MKNPLPRDSCVYLNSPGPGLIWRQGQEELPRPVSAATSASWVGDKGYGVLACARPLCCPLVRELNASPGCSWEALSPLQRQIADCEAGPLTFPGYLTILQTWLFYPLRRSKAPWEIGWLYLQRVSKKVESSRSLSEKRYLHTSPCFLSLQSLCLTKLGMWDGRHTSAGRGFWVSRTWQE